MSPCWNDLGQPQDLLLGEDYDEGLCVPDHGAVVCRAVEDVYVGGVRVVSRVCDDHADVREQPCSAFLSTAEQR